MSGRIGKAAAGSRRRQLDVVARAGRQIARARSRGDLFDRFVECLGDLGLHGVICTVEADQARLLAAHLPPGVATRVDELTGRRLADLSVSIDEVEALRAPVRLRTAARDEASPAALMRMLGAFSAAAELGLRDLPAVPVAGIPVEAGDELLGVVVAWGSGCDETMVPLLEVAASQLGTAWRFFEEHPATAADTRVGEGGGELIDYVRALLHPGRIRAALQPVLRLSDRTVLAYEALSRFSAAGPIRTPDDLFAAATVCDMDTEVDAACLAAGLAEAHRTVPATLFLNVTVRNLLTGDDPAGRFAALAAAATVDPATIVLEFSERDPIPEVTRLRRVAADLRKHGFRIAVDDAGAGHASMFAIAEVRPEFVKVDRSLIHAIHADAARRALVVSLLSFSAHINARLIAEGIETEAELRTLLELGVQFGQGWHLGHPVLVAPAPDAPGAIEVSADWFGGHSVAAFARGRIAGPRVEGVTPRVRTGGETHRAPESLARALSHAASALQSERDPRRICEVMAAQLLRVVAVDDMVIYAADPAVRRFVPMFAMGDESEQVMAYSFPLDSGITGWAFTVGAPQNIGNAAAHPAAGQVPGTPVYDESTLFIPLIAGDRKLGMLNCSRRGLDRFSDDDLEAATLFAHTAAAAWRNAQLYAELAERAITDPLTGLLNSRWLRDSGEVELEHALQAARSTALLLIDIDRFKAVNDSAGHAAGDLVLQQVAREVRSAVRSGDPVIRLGGEEFLVMLRDADESGATAVAEAVRRALRRVRPPFGGAERHVTASIGIAVAPEDGTVLSDLVRAADLAMYAAKHAGRDCSARAHRAALTAAEPESSAAVG